ncbi:phospholipase A [Sulfuriferula sp.]|uniref:phospholipase A n=1 Tax=Sulfuriferula sp. TaxID=2025307 RepID=UPI0027309EE3|nr:phospholipase A [Sulfuriferula sp.]MDP2024712.1 phospholipase A [Sulfuriferula sp.]
MALRTRQRRLAALVVKSSLLGILQVGSAQAAPVPNLGTCPAIKSDTERLACFDKLAGAIPPVPALASKPKSAQQPVVVAEPVPETAPAQSAPAALPEVSLLSRQWELDDADKHGTFQFRPHRATYLLPVKYSDSPNNAPFQGNLRLDSVEAKIQFSTKTKVVEGLLNKNVDLWLAYTVTSFWQAYNHGASAPFRETDYSPEAMLVVRTNYDIAGLTGRFINLGLAHESNGRSVALSRSWNRVYAQFGFERGDFALMIRPWYRIPESASQDNNPDIEDYLGRGDLEATYNNNGHTYSLLLRNNLKSSHNRGAVEVSWSFPLQGRLKGYVQYFNGYGESLIDYNHSQQSLGIGFSLADWM